MAEHDPFDWYFRHNPFSLERVLVVQKFWPVSSVCLLSGDPGVKVVWVGLSFGQFPGLYYVGGFSPPGRGWQSFIVLNSCFGSFVSSPPLVGSCRCLLPLASVQREFGKKRCGGALTSYPIMARSIAFFCECSRRLLARRMGFRSS